MEEMISKKTYWITPLIVILLILSHSCANGTRYGIWKGSHDSTMLWGDEGDKWEINVIETNGSINIRIFESNNFLGQYSRDKDNPPPEEWSITNVSSGKWYWKQPTNNLYYIVFENLEDHEISIRWNVNNTGQSDSIPLIGYLLLSVVIINIFIGYFIITYPIYWKKKK